MACRYRILRVLSACACGVCIINVYIYIYDVCTYRYTRANEVCGVSLYNRSRNHAIPCFYMRHGFDSGLVSVIQASRNMMPVYTIFRLLVTGIMAHMMMSVSPCFGDAFGPYTDTTSNPTTSNIDASSSPTASNPVRPSYPFKSLLHNQGRFCRYRCTSCTQQGDIEDIRVMQPTSLGIQSPLKGPASARSERRHAGLLSNAALAWFMFGQSTRACSGPGHELESTFMVTWTSKSISILAMVMSIVYTYSLYLYLQGNACFKMAKNNGPCTAYSLYFSILGHYFGLFWRSRYT